MTRYYNPLSHARRVISVSKYSKSIFKIIAFAFLVVSLGSCQKGILKIGEGLFPAGDGVSISGTDTLSAFAYLRFDDSLRTDGPTLSYLGNITDPYFGTTTAGIVTQIRLKNPWDEVPFVVDSTELFLHVLTAQGGSGDVVHTFNLYEIGQKLDKVTPYYSSTVVPLTGFKVENIALPTLRTDTVNDLELSLPGKGVTLGTYLTRLPSMLFYSDTVYNNVVPDFRDFFKGFYFEMNPSTEPLIVSFSLLFNQVTFYNYFVVYGHAHTADDSTTVKSYIFNLDAKNANASFNKYQHDFTSATLGDKMAHVNTTYKDTLSYFQSLNGVYTKIALPGLEKVKQNQSQTRIAVNRARLAVPVQWTKHTGAPYISKVYPASLLLRYQTTAGTKLNVPDYAISSSTSTHYLFDGTLDTVNYVYHFNIPAFVQAYLEDTKDLIKPEVEVIQDPSIILSNTNGTRNAIFRVNKNKPTIKFEFTYTKF